jgi:hypothetical protein
VRRCSWSAPSRPDLTFDQLGCHRGRRPGHDLGERPRRQIPDPLLSVTPDDHHLALVPQDVEQHRRALSLVVPAADPPPLGGAILQVASPQRAAATQLCQDVSHELVVGGQPLPDVGVALPVAIGVAAHGDPVHRKIADRHDMHPVLEQRAVLPEQPFELGHPEPGAQSAEQHEVLGPRDDGGWIDLHLAQIRHDLKDRGRARRIQQLTHDGQLPGTAARDPDGLRHGPRA